ncbi:MAG TPA: hypothetical protein VK283_12280 [Acidimicrobiales bacterium]|nr:hypothetical protein [Acidimicrobiales bacterium]
MTTRFRASAYVPIAILVTATGLAAVASLATTAARHAPLAWHEPGSPPATSESDPNAAAATDEARRLLGLVPAPDSGWAPEPSAPTQSLAAPIAVEATPDLVDLYQLWRAPGTFGAVQAWVSSHPPTGSHPAGSGTSSGNGTVLETSLTYAYPVVADRFESRQLVVAFAPLPRRGVGIRVDAQVVWYPSRPAAERIPAGTTRVTATVYTRTGLTGSPENDLGRASFRYRPVVRLLAGLVDSLPMAVPGPRSCPADTGARPQLELDFSGGPHVPEVKVHDDTNGCGGIAFRVGQTAQPPLTDDGLFHRVDQLLGLDLRGIDGT